MDQQNSYPHDIPSIHQKYPEIPIILGNLDLNRAVTAGDPLNYQEVVHANAIAGALKSHRDSGDPLVTLEMVQTASSRAVAIETAHAAVEFCPQNIFIALQQIGHRLENVDNTLQQYGHRLENVDNTLQNIDNHVKIGLAQTANLRIVSRNTRLQAPLQLLPLQKTVVGYGRPLVLPLLNALDAAGRQTFHMQFPVIPVNVIEVGDVPLNFSPRIEAYRHMDIFRMIVFYNQNFDIVPQDDLPERISKFRRFLAEY